MGSFDKHYRKMLPELALSMGIITISSLLFKQSIRSALRDGARRLLRGDFRGGDVGQTQVPVEVEHDADQIMQALNNRGAIPEMICIDGLPGSGKSTLGRALAERCRLEWRTLYWNEIRDAYPFSEGNIYENMRLIRTQDMDAFDAVIYIDCAAEEAKRRVISRNRNTALVDVVDFPKLKRIGDAAFEMLDGEEISPEQSAVRMKLRPRDGYGDMENLKAHVREKGFETEGFSKEELLFIHCYKKPQSGVSPYVRFGAYNRQVLSGISFGLTVALVRRFIS